MTGGEDGVQPPPPPPPPPPDVEEVGRGEKSGRICSNPKYRDFSGPHVKMAIRHSTIINAKQPTTILSYIVILVHTYLLP
jgi:hypothetical protein